MATLVSRYIFYQNISFELSKLAISRQTLTISEYPAAPKTYGIAGYNISINLDLQWPVTEFDPRFYSFSGNMARLNKTVQLHLMTRSSYDETSYDIFFAATLQTIEILSPDVSPGGLQSVIKLNRGSGRISAG